MDDRLLVRVQHLANRVEIAPSVKVVADAKRLEVAVAVQLLIVGVGDALKTVFILRAHDCDLVASEIAARHGNEVNLVAVQQPAHQFAKAAILIRSGVMEFVDCEQAVVECLSTKALICKAQRRVGANQSPVIAVQKCLQGIDFAARAACFAGTQVPTLFNVPVGKETMIGQYGTVKRCTDGAFRHGHNGLGDALIVQFIQRHEHECAGFARCGRCLDEQVLRCTRFPYARLHRPHS